MKALAEQIAELDGVETYGRVVGVRGLMVEVAGPIHAMSVGARVVIESGRDGRDIPCEVVGFSGENALLMPFGALEGVRRGCRAIVRSAAAAVRPSPGLARPRHQCHGRADRRHGPAAAGAVALWLPQRPAVRRMRAGASAAPLDLGVRALNTFTTCCRGQRMGIFAGSGVGKSVLLSMLARNVQADVSVIGLIGERGREVQEFLQDDLGPEGLARSVVIVATSDEPALMRRQAAYLTLAVAEYFRDIDKDVLVLMDSVTRFAIAQREIGLSAGEPPTAKGYTPTVFTELPRLLERAGPGTGAGTITGLFTVLVEGDDHNEPVVRRGARHPRRPHRDGAADRRARPLSGDQRAQVGVADHAEGGRPGLPAGGGAGAPGDGDLCGYGGADPARRLPGGVERRGRRGDPPASAAGGRSWPRPRRTRPVLGKDINALSKSSVPWKPKTNTVGPHCPEWFCRRRAAWPLRGGHGVCFRAALRVVSAPRNRDFGGVRVDEVTRNAHSPEEISGRRKAPQGRADRRHDRRVRSHRRRPRARDQDRAGPRRHPRSRRISPIRPMPRPPCSGARTSSARLSELRTQLDEAQAHLGEAFEELKKVELLDERDQMRERAEEEAREQAELDAIGMMRNGARA